MIERDRGRGGYTLIEVMIVAAVMLILAMASLPVATFTNKRMKEAELRAGLRSLRNAIDEYKRYSDAGLLVIKVGSEGYPSELEELLEPQDLVGQVDKRMRFLRSIPVDPMIGEADWGLRGVGDEPDSSSWDGDSVFDVYSLSEGVGLNGIPYREW
jgi:general secretion pathway protein G